MTHTKEQPGLHAHSWNPATDLMKQYVVIKSLGEGKGWLWLASFADKSEGVWDMENREQASEYNDVFRLFDQFNNNVVLY